jgi:hypothetical protein
MSTAYDLITDFEDFAPTETSYGAVKTNTRGGKSIKIQDSKKNTLILSTPLMLTWGINKMVDDDTGKISYSVSLQFPSEMYAAKQPEAVEFLEKMKTFENKILDDCVKNSKEWFGKAKMSREVAEALYTPMLKYPKDKETGDLDYSRAPTLRIKIPFWDGKFNTELYSMDESPIFNDFNANEVLANQEFETLIPKTSYMIGCIQCNGIWMAGGKFGVTWQLTQAMIRQPVRIKGKCFLKARASDHAQLQEIAEREAEQAAKAEVEDEISAHAEAAVTHEVEDSDNEQELEAAPVKTSKPKRKVVRKKAT